MDQACDVKISLANPGSTHDQAHQAIFDQLGATGARIKTTMMVRNYD